MPHGGEFFLAARTTLNKETLLSCCNEWTTEHNGLRASPLLCAQVGGFVLGLVNDLFVRERIAIEYSGQKNKKEEALEASSRIAGYPNESLS